MILYYERSKFYKRKITFIKKTESEFNKFEPRLKSTNNRFQFSAGLNLETLNTILSEANNI